MGRWRAGDEGSGRDGRDGRLRLSARREGQVVCRDVDDHGRADEDRRDPEERAVMHPLPTRAVRRMFGRVFAPVLLEFGFIHGWNE